MPFIIPVRRTIIDNHGLKGLDKVHPGDLCYKYYKAMVDEWKANPRWTTAHNIYLKLMVTTSSLVTDESVAYHLAWQVFFNTYVMDYERRKMEENGAI